MSQYRIQYYIIELKESDIVVPIRIDKLELMEDENDEKYNNYIC